jgi:actin-related protein
MQDDESKPTSSNLQTISTRARISKKKVQYDYYSSLINREQKNDGDYEVVNPIDPVTGLWYDAQHSEKESSSKLVQGKVGGGTAATAKSSINANDIDDVVGEGADWSDLLPILYRHGCDKSLGLETDEQIQNHPLLLLERSYNPPPIRQQCLEILFEEIGVPATFLAKDAVCATYSCGRTSATVIDIGYSGMTVTPVVDGYVESVGIRRNPVGLTDVDSFVLQNLDKAYHQAALQNHFHPHHDEVLPLYQVRKYPGGAASPPTCLPRAEIFHQAARLHVAVECRESGAGSGINTTPGAAAATVVSSAGPPTGGTSDGNANNKQGAAAAAVHVPAIPFSIPDGNSIDVPSVDRFATANLIVGGSLLGDDILSRRERKLQATKDSLTMYIEQGSYNESVAAEEDGMDIDSSNKETKLDDGKYSDATAVGISKRRAQRDRKLQEVDGQLPRPKPLFHNHTLKRACLKHLQTLSDQFLTSSPIANMVCDAAYLCERDQQAVLLGNVVLTGGGACLGPMEQSVPEYLREQIEALIHLHTPGWRVKVLSPGLPERAIGSWLGGSILASMGTFHPMWITKAEYDDWGTAIVNRKCP